MCTIKFLIAKKVKTNWFPKHGHFNEILAYGKHFTEKSIELAQNCAEGIFPLSTLESNQIWEYSIKVSSKISSLWALKFYLPILILNKSNNTDSVDFCVYMLILLFKNWFRHSKLYNQLLLGKRQFCVRSGRSSCLLVSRGNFWMPNFKVKENKNFSFTEKYQK